MLQGGSNGVGRGDLGAGATPPAAPAEGGPDRHMEEFFKEVAAIKARTKLKGCRLAASSSERPCRGIRCIRARAEH